MPVWLNIFFIFVFMLVGSVFSGTEMALVSLRSSQIERMEQEDERGAHVAQVARDPNRFLSALQIGVTLAGFLSASFGASSLSPHIVPILTSWGMSEAVASGLTMVVLTLLISYFSIVISELVPKRIALQQSEQIARAMVPTIDVFATITSPIVWLIGKNTNGIVRLLGFDPNEVESEVSNDELRVLVSSNTRLSTDEREILADVFGAEQTIVAEVMRPRADVVFLDGTMSLPAAAAFVREQPYSRFPVTGESFDDILGFVHVRDLLDVRDPNAKTVSDVTREIIQLPGTSRILPSMSIMRKRGIHLAVVIDEYGGTDGIVTLEDITEELVGDIHDEYDLPEDGETASQSAFVNGILTIEGGMTLEDFREVSGIELNDGPYETVAGYMIAHTGELGYEGQVLSDDDGYDMVVTEVDGRRIQTIEVRKHDNDSAKSSTEDTHEKSGEKAASNASATDDKDDDKQSLSLRESLERISR
ncbi:HlyC/CorC family transporter [Alloscardovia theropitheci]|uniref:HlyC/CorC family transporter n=1 Tax=Alloscardovia theropitheci TaxID=2496842 RepID=A0A4R0QXU9_9BIFI|nr:hemolysin family protein [Alloscardovia theropitheci]TCD54331.1 HlyC/CorC family transporter [Alloscardovia theropitheci]